MAITLTLHSGFPAGTAYARNVGQATASGIGHSLFTGVGAAAGVAVGNGVGASSTSTGVGVGESAGTATVTGVGRSLASGVGSAAGAATVTGVGAVVPAIIYDGVQGFLKHTGGPTGAADGRRWAFALGLTKNSDGTAMTLVDIPGTVPLMVEIQSDNTVDVTVGTAGAVAAVSSTATVMAADGPVVIIAQGYQNRAFIDIKKASGFTAGPADTPGTAGDIDFTADWYFGADGGAANFGDFDLHFIWGHLAYLGGGDKQFADQFMDDSGNIRDLGTNGSGPLGGQTQPLVCHVSSATAHVANAGSGGDADAGGTFTDGTSPGLYAAALANAFDLFAAAEAWWSMDHAANTVTSGAFQTLADRTANANNPTQTTSGRRPSRTDTSGVISAEFDGANPSTGDDNLNIIAGPTSGLRNWANAGGNGGTIYLAVRPDGGGEGNNGKILTHGDFFHEIGVGDESGGNVCFVFYYQYSGADLFLKTNVDIPTAAKHILGLQYDSNDGTTLTNIIMAVDGDERTTAAGINVTTTPTGSATTPANDIIIGNNTNGSLANTFDGGMYEIVVCGTEHDAAARDRAYQHLGRKYGVTVS